MKNFASPEAIMLLARAREHDGAAARLPPHSDRIMEDEFGSGFASGNQLSVPSQQRVRRDQRFEFI
jgi:hypothetical protein